MTQPIERESQRQGGRSDLQRAGQGRADVLASQAVIVRLLRQQNVITARLPQDVSQLPGDAGLAGAIQASITMKKFSSAIAPGSHHLKSVS